MPTVVYSGPATADLDRLFNFVAERDPFSARRAIESIVDAVRLLERHPLIGRPLRGDKRELVISHGRGGYVAIYRFVAAQARVDILRIRHQREAGFE